MRKTATWSWFVFTSRKMTVHAHKCIPSIALTFPSPAIAPPSPSCNDWNWIPSPTYCCTSPQFLDPKEFGHSLNISISNEHSTSFAKQQREIARLRKVVSKTLPPAAPGLNNVFGDLLLKLVISVLDAGCKVWPPVHPHLAASPLEKAGRSKVLAEKYQSHFQNSHWQEESSLSIIWLANAFWFHPSHILNFFSSRYLLCDHQIQFCQSKILIGKVC